MYILNNHQKINRNLPCTNVKNLAAPKFPYTDPVINITMLGTVFGVIRLIARRKMLVKFKETAI